MKYIYRVELVRQEQQPQAPARAAAAGEPRRGRIGGRRAPAAAVAALRAGAQPGNPNQVISDKTRATPRVRAAAA